jgi:hypothetical protein
VDSILLQHSLDKKTSNLSSVQYLPKHMTMKTATTAFLMSMILMLTWRPSEATIQCFSCVSGFSGCDDKFSSTGISVVNCTTNSCLKTKTSAAGVQAVVRACGSGLNTGCSGTSIGGLSGSSCECTTDLCNTAAPVVTVTSLVGLTAAVALATAVVRVL